jgi:hypothetical protein
MVRCPAVLLDLRAWFPLAGSALVLLGACPRETLPGAALDAGAVVSASSSTSHGGDSSSAQADSSASLESSSLESSSSSWSSSLGGSSAASVTVSSSSSGPLRCPGYLAPDEAGGSCTCAARDGGPPCTANNCYGGYHCNTNLAPDRCVPPPTECPDLRCPGFLAPEESGGACTCSPPPGGPPCAANNCYGGFHCNTNVDPNRCVRAPTTCDGGSGGCGSITLAGECQGSTLVYCYNGQLLDLDCATAFESAPATCVLVSASWGYDCAVVGDGACAFTGDQGGMDPAFCATPGAGCVVDRAAGTSACTGGVGTCVSSDAGYTPTCQEGILVVTCSDTQPAGYRCAPGECVGDRCVEPQGGPCDPGGAPLFTCAPGLTCAAAGAAPPTCQ